MAITQTVEVPADRRIILEVPREVPTSQVILTFTPAQPSASENTTAVFVFENTIVRVPHFEIPADPIMTTIPEAQPVSVTGSNTRASPLPSLVWIAIAGGAVIIAVGVALLAAKRKRAQD